MNDEELRANLDWLTPERRLDRVLNQALPPSERIEDTNRVVPRYAGNEIIDSIPSASSDRLSAIMHALRSITDDSIANRAEAVSARKEEEAQNMFLNILNSIDNNKVVQESFVPTNYDIYEQWLELNTKGLKESLDTYFPDRWELKEVTSGAGTREGFKEFVNSISGEVTLDNIHQRITGRSGYDRQHSVLKYKLLIYFPEINITNSKDQRHTIRDLWIKIDFNRILRIIQFGGVRSSRTYIEHQAQYNHSHMSSETNNTSSTCSSCCLGSTHYQTLLTALHADYDDNNMTLFLQQLEDYLSWESLEGGPYQNIENLTQKNYGNSRSTQRSPNYTDLNNAYSQFLAKYSKGYNIQLTDNGVYHQFKVIIDEEFKEKVESICPDMLKQFYDTINKRQYYLETAGVPVQEIERLNSNFRNSGKILTFKDKDIYYQIVEPGLDKAKEIDDLKIVKMAPQQMINHVAQQLERDINNFYLKKFTNELSAAIN